MRQDIRTVYFFNELAEDIQKKVLDKMRDINTDHEWWDFLYEDIITILEFLGFRDIDINFSGFWSQGDGACFMGKYSFNGNWEKELSEHAPLDTEWKKFGEILEALNKTCKELQNCTIDAQIRKSNHHYSHENTVSFDVYSSEDLYAVLPDGIEDSFCQVCKNMMRYIYKLLEEEYKGLTSDELVKNSIMANEYEFTEKGEKV